ncbi:MAG: tRNA threonylcarbamoyladenosine dehydratase [Clostridia bacterium]|nr:tRNA threonylcarbamoyladenosine dehydratase [Clostridia bacterium]
MQEEFKRTALMLGEDAIEKLSKCRVAVFGLGGVGGYVVEALARGGIGALDLIDGDKVSITNINRQILALQTTIGEYKAEAAKRRVLDINPHICAAAHAIYFDGATQNDFDFTAYDYVVDAIDSVTSKLLLAELCQRAGTPLISCMGTGNKLDPMAFKVADISKTSVCPLARVMRRELKKRGVEKLKVVYSEEAPHRLESAEEDARVPASTSFVPPAAGLLIAATVIKELLGI